MSVVYSQDVIDARLNGVITALGASSDLVLKASGVTIVTISLASPAGTVAGGILTFDTASTVGVAAAGGTVDEAIILDSAAATAISGLTVGIPLSGAEIIISNGLNSTVVSAGQTVTFVAGQIVGS